MSDLPFKGTEYESRFLARLKAQEHQCVFQRCESRIEGFADFRDDTSRREFAISGICQRCQDEIFQSPEEDW
jgi:hypothetical protein